MNVLPAALDPDISDSESVATALETAGILWSKGDQDESIRWLKRAAEYAADAGNDTRALSIARHIADLNAAMSQPGALLSRTPSAVMTDSTDPEQATVAAPSLPRDPTLPESPPKPMHRGPAHPPPRSTREHGTDATREQPSGAEMSAASLEPQLPRSGELSFERASVSSPPIAHRALRVFVTSSATNGGNMQVVLARPGQEAPPGMEPALLIPLNRGSQLMG